jgi:hypothetical protein
MNIYLNRIKLLPLYLLILVCVILAGDFITGPYIQFPIFFIIPVALAAWANRLGWALSFAIGMPLVRLLFVHYWDYPWSLEEAIINKAIQMLVFSAFAVLLDRVSAQTQAESRELRILTGILPICCFCKKIRTEDNNWVPMEKYISENSEANFSHGYCPECAKKHYGEYLDK